MTGSLERALSETKRRRDLQTEYNKQNGITPKTITSKIHALSELQKVEDAVGNESDAKILLSDTKKLKQTIDKLRSDMKKAAKDLEFEEAAKLRDQINALEEASLELS